jgi:hypothetical protein
MEIKSVSGPKRVVSHKVARRDLMNIKVRLINTAFSTGNAFLPNYKSNSFMNSLKQSYKRGENRKKKEREKEQYHADDVSTLDFSRSYEPLEINY